MRTMDGLKKATAKSKLSALISSYRKARNAINSLNIQLKKNYFNDKDCCKQRGY